MRYWRIFLLHFQDVFHSRSRSFVWFLVSFINAFIYLLFWRGAIAEKGEVFGVWNVSTITTYYLLIIIIGSFLTVHIEEDVALRDIQEGGLARYLLRPFSYFATKFMEEIPWRIIQGSFSVVTFFIFQFVLGIELTLVTDVIKVIFAIAIIALGLGMSYIFKMVLGLTAFWTTDYHGIQNLIDVITIIFGGYIVPLSFYPGVFHTIAFILPVAYFTYFPVAAIEGILTVSELSMVVTVQLVWIVLLYGLYKFLWRRGIATFTSVGQ
jgi:ABC-2 type transport system permease protein